MADDPFSRVPLDQIPQNEKGQALVNLYVLIPSVSKYLIYVPKGQSVGVKLEKLKSHVVPEFFVPTTPAQGSELSAPQPGALSETSAPANNVHNLENSKAPDFRVGDLTPEKEEEQVKVFKGEKQSVDMVEFELQRKREEDEKRASAQVIEFNNEVLGKEAEQSLKAITRSLLEAGNTTPPETLAALEKKTNEIIEAVAPEAASVKSYIMRYANHLTLMNDASAITTLTVLFAFANGFDSRKSFKELTFATLVMDVGLSTLTDEEMKLYYTDRTKLSAEANATILSHPVKSHQIAVEKLKSLSDITLQLILTHHELFNGKGYPRGIRSETLPPLNKVLALGVDVFEYMKKCEILGSPTTIVIALEHLRDEAPEAHLRRHNKKILDTSIEFMKQGALELEAANQATQSASKTPAG